MRGATFLALATVLVGCGRTAAEPATYTGRAGASGIDVGQVTTEASRPPGYEILGQVTSRCRADDGVVTLAGESLADVDCSDTLLEAGLREKAASVGGAALVGLRCVVTPESRGDLLASVLHTCKALVAAPASRAATPESAGAADPAARSFVPPYASPSQAFRVSVTLLPADPSAAPRWSIPSDSVAELAYVPVGRVATASIVARCSDGCDKAVVRHAVRAAAGRVGATDVVGVSCVRDSDGLLCTGRAAEIDESMPR